MKRSRRTFLAIIAAAVATGGALFTFGVKDGISVSSLLTTGEPVRIAIASSVTKQKWLEAAATDFAAQNLTVSSGRPIEIEISPVLSGELMLQIAAESLQPTAWSPGERAWVDQLSERWDRTHPNPISSAACTPTVLTPVGLAMWRPMAEALGWPTKPVSWGQLIELANDPEGWSSYGHPEWGRMRLGHTHPQYSSAGLLFLASVIYATTGKTDGISVDDIYSPEVEAALRSLAQNTSKYGMVTTDLLNSMAKFGPSFLHVTSAFEEGTVRFNLERQADLRWPLAFIFPQEGTFWSDHPFCILDKSGWVSPEQAEATTLFRDFLLSHEMQAKAEEFFLRPLDVSIPLGSSLSLVNGTDPSVRPEKVPAFAIPSPEISEAIIDQFQVTKRKATIVLALDVSGSMQGEPIKAATEATAEFLSRLDPKDRVGLIAFNHEVKSLASTSDVSSVAETMRNTVLALPADGGTNLYGAVCMASKMIELAQKKDREVGDNRLYGIVLLSDGKDTQGETSENKMFQTCLKAGSETEGAKLFVISLGEDTDKDVLERLARETNGALFTADAASIGAAYLKISAEQ